MIDYWLRWLSLPAWALCLACLTPAVWRLLCRRPRYMDPIWLIVFLLALNRVSFLLRLSSVMSHASALFLALAMGGLSLSYQRCDRENPR